MGPHVQALLAVNPVPWARAQMAFTLATHIILVPLGVSWAFMALIANYRGLRRNDRDALELAQRWSKYMAVTFAVGAVTGTVLSFEFGLLWPRFMGQWGEAFGVPFAFEGLFFFTEAIFIAIYIYGWRRMKPWTHFWCGVPLVVTGVLGSISVVSANAWMNSPEGVTLNSAGEVVDVDPLGVIFNDAMPLMAAHMVVAAYVVGGFLVASVYAVGMLRGRRDRHHRLGFLIPFTVAAVATPIQMGVGDSLARWVYENQPAKFAAIELVPESASDVPETLLGRLTDDGTVSGGIPIPGLASWLSDPSTGTSTVIEGLDSFPEDERPTVSEVNTVHLAWDVMVGLGTLLFLLSAWYALELGVPARHAQESVVPARGCGRWCRGDRCDGGRLGRQRGRPAAVDRVQPDEGRGRRHREHRRVDHLRRDRRAVRRPGRDDDPDPAQHEPALPPARPCGARRAVRPERPGARGSATRGRDGVMSERCELHRHEPVVHQ